jgi:hypothetical protein
MDRRTLIKGAMAGVAVALLPTIPVEEPNAISFTVSGLSDYGDSITIVVDANNNSIKDTYDFISDHVNRGVYKNVKGIEVQYMNVDWNHG